MLDDIYAFNPYGELRLELSAGVLLSPAAFVYAWRIVVASLGYVLVVGPQWWLDAHKNYALDFPPPL